MKIRPMVVELFHGDRHNDADRYLSRLLATGKVTELMDAAQYEIQWQCETQLLQFKTI